MININCLWCDMPVPTHTRGGLCPSCGARLPEIFIVIEPKIESIIGDDDVDE